MSVQQHISDISGDRRVLPDRLALAPRMPASHSGAIAGGRTYAASKRAIDIAVALCALLFLLPLLVLIAIAIKLDSAGPVIFRQTRHGLNGRPFLILKFRTMHVVEDGAQVVQAARNDRRVTRAGRFLRAASLDELPQLWNVVRGEMSLVGPRPHAAVHDALYGALIPNYLLRQRAKPGITGWAQVNGYRGGTPTLDLMQRRIDLDAWYVEHASTALDISIMLRTPHELLRRRNAY